MVARRVPRAHRGMRGAAEDQQLQAGTAPRAADAEQPDTSRDGGRRLAAGRRGRPHRPALGLHAADTPASPRRRLRGAHLARLRRARAAHIRGRHPMLGDKPRQPRRQHTGPPLRRGRPRHRGNLLHLRHHRRAERRSAHSRESSSLHRKLRKSYRYARRGRRRGSRRRRRSRRPQERFPACRPARCSRAARRCRRLSS